MDFACIENPSNGTIYAQRDPSITKDPRVLENLLKEERTYVSPCNYFEEVQNDVEPYMRKVVTAWMLEVSTIVG